MKHASLTIRTPADLACLLDRRRHYGCIRVDAPGMPEHQRLRWQVHLWQRYSACGCDIGHLFGVLGAGAGGVYFAVVEAGSGPWAHGAAALSLMAAIIAICAWAGAVRARRRLQAAAQALHAVLDERAA